MLDPFELMGFWWLPETPNNILAGTLRFSQDGGGKLELLGLFQEFQSPNQLHNPVIILGVSTDGSPITLYRCYRNNFNLRIPGISTSTYQILTIFRGAYFQKEQDILFRDIAVNYTDLDEWVGISGFNIDHSNLKIEYKKPEPIRIDIDDDFRLSIVFSRKGPSTSFVTKEITITQRTYLKLEYKAGDLSFENFRKKHHLLSDLLTLGVCRPVFPVYMAGTTEKAKNEAEGQPAYYPPVEIYYQLIEQPLSRKPLIPDEMLFSYQDIKPRFERFIRNWFSKSEELRVVLDLYFGSQYSQRLFINYIFLNIIQALETYHRLRMTNQVLSVEEHRERVEEILSLVPAKYQTWLKGLITPANQPTLRIRLKEIVQKYTRLITPMVGDNEEFIARIVATRNHEIHHTHDKKAITDTGELFSAIRTMTILLESLLLEELGFSQDEVLELQQKRKRLPI